MEKRILELVREKGEATLSDLYAALPEYPRHSVRSKASVLAKRGVLRKVRKGVYALPESATEDARPAAEDTTSEPATDASEEATSRKDTSSAAGTDKADAAEDNVLTKTISEEELRRRVLRLLRRQPDATPEELAEVLSANADTIRRIIAELIDQGDLEPLREVEATARAGDKNAGGARCFYAPVCRDIPGMRKVCEHIGSLLCEQQKTTRPATATP